MNPQAVLSGEAGLAGIQETVRGSASRRLLRRHLEQLAYPGSRFGPLHLTRVKYKPGRRLSAYYTGLVVDPVTGVARGWPVAATWRYPQAALEPDEDLAQQLQAEAGERGLLAPFARLQSDLPERGFRLQIWPLDPEFPQLVRVGDPAYTPHLLQAAGVPLAIGPQSRISIVPVRYRPGDRHVLRIQVDPPDGPLLYAKLYRSPEMAARAARIANRAVDWLDANLVGFRGTRPAGVSLEDAVVIHPHAAGQPLSQQLDRSPAWLEAQLRLVGEALATLHRGPASLTSDLEAVTLVGEIKVVQRASEHVQILLPEVGGMILGLLERLRECYARLPQEKATFTHSDFKADHLLIGPQGMALIDFDTCALADPALDVGKFLADLEWWYARTRLPGVEQAQRAFLRGYPGIEVGGRLQRARLYQALILVKIAIRRTRLDWRDWAAVTAHLVRRAEQLLQEAL